MVREMEKLNRKEIALVHVAAKQIGLDDDTYRDVLHAQAGVRSSKDLDRRGFKRVMLHFQKCGFVTKDPESKPNRPGFATQHELNLIKILWHKLEGTYYKQGAETRALRGFLKKRYHIDHENFITSAQAYNVIEAIKSIVIRKGKA